MSAYGISPQGRAGVRIGSSVRKFLHSRHRRINLRIRLFAFLSVIGMLSSIVEARPVDLIINGSFENPNILDFWGTTQPATGDILSGPTGNWVQLQAGNTEMPGWTVTQGNIEIIRLEWPAFDGAQSVDLVGFVLGGLQQSFNTTPGQIYHLSFEYANNPLNGGGTARIDLIGQSTLFSDTIAHSNSGNPNMNWVNYSADFVADSNSTALRFTALTQTNQGGVVLDSVSVVQAVPEPASVILAGTCLVLLVFCRRRSRSRKENAVA